MNQDRKMATETKSTAEEKVQTKKRSLFSSLASDKFSRYRNVIHLIFAVCAMIPVCIQLFMPLCHLEIPGVSQTLWIGGYFETADDPNPAVASFAFLQMALMLALIGSLLLIAYKLLRIALSFSKEEETARRAKGAMIISTVTVGFFALFLTLFPPINCFFGGTSEISFQPLPLIIGVVIALLYALFTGMVSLGREKTETDDPESARLLRRAGQMRRLRSRRLELLIYTLISSACSIIAIFAPIAIVTFDQSKVKLPEYTISGYESLLNMTELQTAGERTVAFFLYAMVLVASVLLFVTLVSYLGRSSFFSKISVGTLVMGGVFCLMLALFSQYYSIVQQLNIETIVRLLMQYSVDPLTEIIATELAENVTYEVSGYSLYFLAGALAVMFVAFIRRPYTRIADIEREIAAEDAAALTHTVRLACGDGEETASAGSAGNVPPALSADSTVADPCPAFTELDIKSARYKDELEEKKAMLFENPSLPALVEFIVSYARNSRHHLFYTSETVAAFLSGLGTTRLTILQGMSGTGKTSLPKIVCEALCSVCDIVEVESSWRDKNELLGYYNEFNRTYTPKKFTRMLYNASLRPDIVTLIVLDEMNLSRIEYYFSDFLSLMEHEEDAREIRLLNVPLARRSGERVLPYKALIDGHTLKVPQNVWFIGTANRDESTYDISDKVYDRAHTMNFDKRASKMPYYGEAEAPRFLPASELLRLFDEARALHKIDLDRFPVVSEVERLLAPYGISFGNRVAMQMESFVSVYAACFRGSDAVLQDALETILLSKVVRKLELKTIDDKESLADEFERLHLLKCAEFIRGMRED